MYRLLVLGSVFFNSLPVFAQGKVEDIVATHVRRQGYECKQPIGAEPLPEGSLPEEMAWRLQCKNAVYEVRLIPHSAAVVRILTVTTD